MLHFSTVFNIEASESGVFPPIIAQKAQGKNCKVTLPSTLKVATMRPSECFFEDEQHASPRPPQEGVAVCRPVKTRRELLFLARLGVRVTLPYPIEAIQASLYEPLLLMGVLPNTTIQVRRLQSFLTVSPWCDVLVPDILYLRL